MEGPVLHVGFEECNITKSVTTGDRLKYQAHGSVHRNSVLIKIQPDATVCRYLFIAKSLYIKLDCSVCTCLTHLYDGRDMYRIYYIKNNYMFRHFTLAIFRLRNEKS